MSEARRLGWVGAALLVGLVYFLIGRLFPQPAEHLQAWRLAAWIASGIAFAAHIAYEHFALRNAPRPTALHAALAVAIGAFALAVAGIIHSLTPGWAIQPKWLLALVLWPAFTAIPAFLAAMVAATLLARLTRVPRAG